VEHQEAARGTPHWYVMRVGPFEGLPHGVVVSHTEVSDRMMARFALEAANKRLEGLSKRVIAVQEEERRAISVGLHEDIGQSLSALKIGLHRLTQEKGEAAQKLLTECLATADATLDRLRLMALELRPPQLDQLGLEDALGWLAARQRDATGVAIECRCSIAQERRPSAALESACYRIAQEALNNAARHARAKSIRVGVDSDGRLLKLTISDDGVGFDPGAGHPGATGGTGLISMEERARLAGGRLKVRSVAGGGTTLSAIFPLHAEPGGEEGADLAQPWA
jgi:signal transduction histidine kinase